MTRAVTATKRLAKTVRTCVGLTGATWVLTSHGPRQACDLVGQPFIAMVNGEAYKAAGFRKLGTRPAVRVRTHRGYEVTIAPDQKLLVERARKPLLKLDYHGGPKRLNGFQVRTAWVEAGELEPGDMLILGDNDGVSWGAAREDAHGWLVGEVLGDGVYNTGKEQYAHVRFWGPHAEALARRAYAIVDKIPLTYTQGPVPTGPVHVPSAGHWQVTSRKLSNLCLGMLEPATKLILPGLEARSSSFIVGFLRGWYDADGCVLGSIEKGRNVTLCSSTLANLKIAQRMLARLGIGSRLHPYRTEKGIVTFPDSKGALRQYQQQATHELMVTRSSLMRFAERVGFSDPNKAKKLAVFVDHDSYKQPYTDILASEVTHVIEVQDQELLSCKVAGDGPMEANGFIAQS